MTVMPQGSIVEGVPDDILFNHVLCFCSVRDVVSLGRTSKAQNRRLLNTQSTVWQALASSWYPEVGLHVKRDVGEGGNASPSVGEEEDAEKGKDEDSLQGNTLLLYDGYRDVVADDDARHCQVVWMDLQSPVLLVSLSHHASPDHWCTCEVNIIDISTGTSRRSGRTVRIYTTLSSKGIHGMAMEDWVGQSSITLAKRSRINPRRYGDIVQKLYREGLYPSYCHEVSNTANDTGGVTTTKRNEIAVCDRLAKHALDDPEHAPSDVFKIVMPRSRMIAESTDRPGGFVAWYDFALDDMLDQATTPYDILFSFGNSHPYLPQDGRRGNHPIVLTPLQEFIESGCHGRARAMVCGAWLPTKPPQPYR